MTIIDRVRERYKEVKKEYPEDRIFFIALQGSQNYKLADEESNVDTKCVVLSSLDDIIFNKPAASYTKVLDNDEHIDIKDIRLMLQQYRKQNINFVETLFSEYDIVNQQYKSLWDELQNHREEIAHYNAVQAMKTMCGMCSEKYHALFHEYTSRIKYFELFGFDAKQLHHSVRVYQFMKNYSNGKPYKECLIPDDINYMLSLKRNSINLSIDDAKEMSDMYMELAVKLKEEFENSHESKADDYVDDVLDNVQRNIIMKYLKSKLGGVSLAW